MKLFFKKTILITLPLTISAFCLVTAKGKIICDGGTYTAYGFPFWWTMPGATSLSSLIDLSALVFDFAVYLAAFTLISVTPLFDKFLAKTIWISFFLWFVAILIGVLFVWLLSTDVYFGKIVFDNSCLTSQSYFPHFGFPWGR